MFRVMFDAYTTARATKDYAFHERRELIIVNLGEGLEEIGEGAFSRMHIAA